MKLSVIIPVYGVEATLDRCVESVLCQQVEDMEVILVDDGSPDQCPQKCDEWAQKDSRIRVIHKRLTAILMLVTRYIAGNCSTMYAIPKARFLKMSSPYPCCCEIRERLPPPVAVSIITGIILMVSQQQQTAPSFHNCWKLTCKAICRWTTITICIWSTFR